jgi:hypothetical protein
MRIKRRLTVGAIALACLLVFVAQERRKETTRVDGSEGHTQPALSTRSAIIAATAKIKIGELRLRLVREYNDQELMRREQKHLVDAHIERQQLMKRLHPEWSE